ncbi:MAG: hypothetical protein H6R42_15 [Nitrospirae bacterium]|jgi:hypothetical protein|nr:hypothetical protein [Nitrospirota bacterium]MBS1232361.1 hypothetical protein [Nitrospirota bacterium]
MHIVSEIMKYGKNIALDIPGYQGCIQPAAAKLTFLLPRIYEKAVIR